MAEASLPKTPERSIDDAMGDLSLAPRKPFRGQCLSKFLHDPEDRVRYDFHLSGNRVCSPVSGPSPTSVNGCHQRCNVWLNKFCTELGYHNLSFLANYGVAGPITATAAESDIAADGVHGFGRNPSY
ncbi:hypothetical protein DPX16_2098 [Anabarilius grahami]|uniref:Uncharacterized protein n=1 Tax=Anabarilius grahami TaxID=495550 RepID=A0A3N0Y0Z0_ANAGA|nr:hypothetical protein DPX16_2098 [Anabarilius grahami]